MRITKSDAASIALKLTEKKTAQLKKLKTEISQLGYDVLKGQTNKSVFEFYERFPNYFKKIDCINITGKGLNHQRINLPKSLPCTETYNKTVLVDDKNAAKLSALFNQEETIEKEINKLKTDIEVALLSLVTYAKITSEFKEAVPFLPFKEKNALVVNIADIRKKL